MQISSLHNIIVPTLEYPCSCGAGQLNSGPGWKWRHLHHPIGRPHVATKLATWPVQRGTGFLILFYFNSFKQKHKDLHGEGG